MQKLRRDINIAILNKLNFAINYTGSLIFIEVNENLRQAD